MQTTYQITDANGNVLVQGMPYAVTRDVLALLQSEYNMTLKFVALEGK